MAGRRQAVERRPARHRGIRTQCACLDEIAAAAKAAVDDHRHVGPHRLAHRGQHLDRGRHGIELAPAVVAHHHAIRPGVARAQCVLGHQDALHQQLARPQCTQPAHIVPGQRGIHLRRKPGRRVARTVHARRQVAQVAKARHAARHQHVPHPARMPGHIDEVAQVQLHRCAVIAPVPLAVAEHRSVGGKHDRLRARKFGALHHRSNVVAVLERVDLHPVPHPGGNDVLEGDGRHHALTEGDPGRMRNLGQHPVATIRKQTVETGWRDHHRQRTVLAEQGHGKLTLRHIDQGARQPQHLIQRLAVARQRDLVIGTALEILEAEVR